MDQDFARRRRLPTSILSTVDIPAEIRDADGIDEPSLAPESSRVIPAGLNEWPLRRWATVLTFVCVVLVSFVNTIDVHLGGIGPHANVGLDLVVVSKLGISALCGLVALVGLATMPTARALLLGGPGLVLVGLGGVFIVTSLFAVPVIATVSQIASVLTLVYIGFAAVTLETLGLRKIAIAMLIGLILNLIANWLVFTFVKSIGVFIEDLGDGLEVTRMGGLGHPNAIARLAVMSSLIVIAMGRWKDWRAGSSESESESESDTESDHGGGFAAWRASFFSPLAIAVHLLTIVTVVATYSRTATFAGVLAVAIMVCTDFWSRRGLAAILASAAMVLLIGGATMMWRGQDAKLANQSLLGSVTKSGEISELTSATGRTTIWAEVIRLIQLRPATGYGLNSAPVMLEDFSFHTHNSLLHAAFSGGLVAGLLMLMLLIWNVIFGLTDPDGFIRSVTLFLLISGLFEDTVIETFAGPSTLVWFVVLLVPAWRAGKIRKRDHGRERGRDRGDDLAAAF